MLPLQGVSVSREEQPVFQWAPTLGGECYASANDVVRQIAAGFNGHPPLGVNATTKGAALSAFLAMRFQWAPTLGGECYWLKSVCTTSLTRRSVSMGTHPWG